MPGGYISPVPQYTQRSVAIAILNAAGIPASENAIILMTAWMRAEGGHWKNSAKYNPLNTTLERNGSHSINSAGVQAYKSWEDGIRANADTLKDPRYSKIVAALNAQDKDAFLSAVVSSPWGTPKEPLATILGETKMSSYSAGNLVTNAVGTLNPLKGITGEVLGFLRGAGITAGVFVLGIVLVILGIVVLALSNRTVRGAVGTAAMATPEGAALKGLKIGKAAKASRTLTPEMISARESAKTNALVERATKLGEVRRAPKSAPEPMHPSNPAHPLHKLYLRSQVSKIGTGKHGTVTAADIARLRA